MNTRELTAPPSEGELSTLTRVREVRDRVDKILEARKLTQKWFYERIGMSKTGYRQMWDNDSVKVSVLLLMAQVLGVDVSVLLGSAEHIEALALEPSAAYVPRPRYIEERVAELERELQQLKKSLSRK